ncbi:hypothetical protein ACVOMV_23605 [Mesorhizobium atlanticum]
MLGDGEGQISEVVLERHARSTRRRSGDGSVGNPCYFAMDATRPGDLGNSALGQRYYIICEAKQIFRAVSSGHGGGRNLKGVADFIQRQACAQKNFGNAMDPS